MRALAALALGAGLLAAGAAEGATIRQFSYDPANPATRLAAGGLTFVFRQQLIFITLLKVRATEGPATADLRPAEDKALGRSLASLIGDGARERDLYEIEPGADGKAMVNAFCPGSKRGWLALGRLRAYQTLRVHVLGDTPEGPARLCRTLEFSFHGEWKLPAPSTPVEREMPGQEPYQRRPG